MTSEILSDIHPTRPSQSYEESSASSSLIIDGEEARKEILMCIHEAQESIYIRMYMWRDDRAGNMILRALWDKIQVYPQIQIWIEKDAFGSRVYDVQNIISFGNVGGDIFSSDLGRAFLEQRDNIHLSYIGSWWPLRLKYLKENDHSKVFLFDPSTDRSTALLGGMNIADPYLSAQTMTEYTTAGWHDYMVKLTGALADSLMTVKRHKKQKGITGKFQKGIEIFATLKNRFAMRRRILRELSRAQSSIIIEHAYITDTTIIRRLRRLDRKGISIQVIFPAISDGVWHANMHSIRRLLRPSVIHHKKKNTIAIHLYPGMIHAKAILIDHTTAILGSANLTYGSFDFLYETNVIVRGEDSIVGALSIQMERDISESMSVTIDTLPSYYQGLAWIERFFI